MDPNPENQSNGPQADGLIPPTPPAPPPPPSPPQSPARGGQQLRSWIALFLRALPIITFAGFILYNRSAPCPEFSCFIIFVFFIALFVPGSIACLFVAHILVRKSKADRVGSALPPHGKLQSVGRIIAGVTIALLALLVFASFDLLYEWLVLISLADIVAIIMLVVQDVKRKREGHIYSATERTVRGVFYGSLILILVVAIFYLNPLLGFYYEQYVISPGIPNPTADISAHPTDIALGQTTTITWTSTNADRCVVIDNNTATGISESATSGSEIVMPTAPGQADYFMTCYGPDLGRLMTQKFQDAYVLVNVEAQNTSSSLTTASQTQMISTTTKPLEQVHF